MPDSHATAIVGAGLMGHGFAAHFVIHDQDDVTLIDHRQRNLDDARTQIREVVSLLNEHGLADHDPDAVIDDITFTLDLEAGVESADVVMETVTEDLDVKHDVFQRGGDAAPEDALLASNTSGLDITAIAEGAPEHADRIVGTNWWQPPYLMRPVEVNWGRDTSEETVEGIKSFLRSVDRHPVVVAQDAAGYIGNRIQFALIRECMHLVEEGIASLEDVEVMVRDGYALRTCVTGPFESMDITGLDLYQTVADELYPRLCTDTDPSPLFDERLGEGRGGVEDGAGFFEYDEPTGAVTNRRDERIASILGVLEETAE